MSVHSVTFRLNCTLGNDPSGYPPSKPLSLCFETDETFSRHAADINGSFCHESHNHIDMTGTAIVEDACRTFDKNPKR